MVITNNQYKYLIEASYVPFIGGGLLLTFFKYFCSLVLAALIFLRIILERRILCNLLNHVTLKRVSKYLVNKYYF